VVRQIEEEAARREAAELCGTSLSTVGRYFQRYRATGIVNLDKFGGYMGYSTTGHADRINRWVAKQPDVTLQESQARPAKANVTGAASSVFRFQHHLKLSKKSFARGRARLAGRNRHAAALAPRPARTQPQAVGVHR
jgi:transposase